MPFGKVFPPTLSLDARITVNFESEAARQLYLHIL